MLYSTGIETADDLQQAAIELTRRYNCAVLAKGGHLGGNTCTDILVLTDGSTHRWSHPRTLGISTHGTGCTLSSAVAAHLALGHELIPAVELSLNYITRAIAASLKLGELWAVNHAG